MKKLTKKDTTTTKTKTVTKGNLQTLAKIQKTKNNQAVVAVKKEVPSITIKKPSKIEKTETTKTKSTKTLMKSKDGKTLISAKEDVQEEDEYVMIEKTITIKQTKTTFLDDDEEDEMFNDDWFGGSKLKKQKLIEEGIEEEDLDTIIESFGKDDDKYW